MAKVNVNEGHALMGYIKVNLAQDDTNFVSSREAKHAYFETRQVFPVSSQAGAIACIGISYRASIF